MAKHAIDEQAIIRTNIDAAIKEKGWSPKTLAERAGVGVGTVYNIRAGQQIGAGVLYKIAKALGTTVEALAGETAQPARVNAPASIIELNENEEDAIRRVRRLPDDKQRSAWRIFFEVIDQLAT